MSARKSAHEINKCPKCGSKDSFEYGRFDVPTGDTLNWSCVCRNCGWSGCEVYDIQFLHYTDKEGNVV